MALGEMSTEVLKSCTVSNSKVQSTGFTYQYPSIDAAVEQLVR
jgi:NAD dependent epimerase/dehydratase family enzyme